MGDRWCAENYEDSTYVFLPLHFEKEHDLSLEYQEEIALENYR